MGRAAKSVAGVRRPPARGVAVPVELIDESFSTVEAEEVLLAADLSRARRREVIDKMAAAVILRRWLDAKRTMTNPMKRALVVFLITSAIGLIALFVVARTAWRYGDTPGGTAQGQGHRRDPARRVGAATSPTRLQDAGLIGNPTVFRLYAGQRGVAGRFKAGRYEIAAPATPKQILDTLVKGAADELVTVVVPAGQEPARGRGDPGRGRRRRQGRAGRRRRAIRRSPPSWGCPGNTLEGYLFPDTYRLRPRSTPARALIPLVRRHRQVWGELRAAHAKAALRAEEDARVRRPQHRRARVDRREGDGPARGAAAHRAGVHQPPAHADVHAQAAADRPDHHLRLHGGDAASPPPARSGTAASTASTSTIATTPTTRTRTRGCRRGRSPTRARGAGGGAGARPARRSSTSSPRTTAPTNSRAPSPSTTRRS